MTDALKSFSTRTTPQSQPAGGATVKNAAGGYVFAVDDLTRLRRFLVLGSSGGTYYTRAPELTRDNAEVVVRLAHENPVLLVDTITEISVAGRAPKANPGIFALAIAAAEADEAGRAYALAALQKVCRTGTHLFLFMGYVKQFRGRGPALNKAMRAWYLDKPVDKLTYQAVKYRQREGWSHRDVLRLLKPRPYVSRNPDHPLVAPDMAGEQRDALFAWIVGKPVEEDSLPALVTAFEYAQKASAAEAVGLIANHDLSWEMLPDRLLGEPSIWEALISHGRVPPTALMRQLPRLTKLDLGSGTTKLVAERIADPEALKRGRVHPINVLVAQRTYASGRSARGEGTWTPNRRYTDALDAAFYAAYGAVEPSGKRMLLACDVSGSMGAPASGLPISCREVTAALSLVSLNVERDAEVIGFSDGRGHSTAMGYNYSTMGWSATNSVATRLDISPRRRLDDVCKYMDGLNFGRTDCALPMLWARENKLDFDSVTILTDNETWYGQVHPWQALAAYRQHVGHDVKYSVVAMTATGQSIADPSDPSSMDIAGMDTTVPQVLSDFAAGRI